jgi:hypothetical protein
MLINYEIIMRAATKKASFLVCPQNVWNLNVKHV